MWNDLCDKTRFMCFFIVPCLTRGGTHVWDLDLGFFGISARVTFALPLPKVVHLDSIWSSAKCSFLIILSSSRRYLNLVLFQVVKVFAKLVSYLPWGTSKLADRMFHREDLFVFREGWTSFRAFCLPWRGLLFLMIVKWAYDVVALPGRPLSFDPQSESLHDP